MKHRTRLIVCILCIIIIAGLFYSAQAGVEPSPFKNLNNKLNALVNRTEAIQHRLNDVQSKLIAGHYYQGMENQLQSIANGMGLIYDNLRAVIIIIEDNNASSYCDSLLEEMNNGAQGLFLTSVGLYNLCLEMYPGMLPPLQSIQSTSLSISRIIDSL